MLFFKAIKDFTPFPSKPERYNTILKASTYHDAGERFFFLTATSNKIGERTLEIIY